MTTNVFARMLCVPVTFACVTCAPYTPPVPNNPLGDTNSIRVDVTPVNESNPKGPLQMVLRKRIKSGWISLGQLCEAAIEGGAAPDCPAHRQTHLTYVTPGKYKVRAEYVGPSGKTLWGSVLADFEVGYVYTCEVADGDTEGCQRKSFAEAAVAAAAPPVLSSPESTAPAPQATAPSPTPVSSAPVAAGCQKDIDCAGDLICSNGSCVSPTGAAPAINIVPTSEPVVVAPVAKPSACDSCPGECAPHKQACNAGTISSCYELGACLCECKLAAGGCGDSMAALRECVSTNRAKARPKPTSTD